MNIIKEIRIQFGDSQREFAERLSISLDTMKSWEIGRRYPKEAHVEMLMYLNNDFNFRTDLENMHPTYNMANQILQYIDEQQNIHGDDIELRFVLSGESGSGKTRAISIVNEKLPESAELVECSDLIHGKNLCKALGIINDKELKYQDSKHIAFSVLNGELASSLESNGIKIFRFK